MAATGRFSFQSGQPLFAQDDHVLNGFCSLLKLGPTQKRKPRIADLDREAEF
jgi:hypothetical protein